MWLSRTLFHPITSEPADAGGKSTPQSFPSKRVVSRGTHRRQPTATRGPSRPQKDVRPPPPTRCLIRAVAAQVFGGEGSFGDDTGVRPWSFALGPVPGRHNGVAFAPAFPGGGGGAPLGMRFLDADPLARPGPMRPLHVRWTTPGTRVTRQGSPPPQRPAPVQAIAH